MTLFFSWNRSTKIHGKKLGFLYREKNHAPQTCHSKSESCYDPFAVTCGSLGFWSECDISDKNKPKPLKCDVTSLLFFHFYFATCCVVIFKPCLSTPQHCSRQRRDGPLALLSSTLILKQVEGLLWDHDIRHSHHSFVFPYILVATPASSLFRLLDC